ncbi:amidohydrolase family protein [Tunicatimonas pelagia]|uniref:amidohydrolase family protein n=1 Tax=Tunicatimonas pelagia TaxID=931531 RepID=UPI002664E8B2|nr:amidohydrolase family protein [Tunicatimonas pelagia]WKN44749.1 amidohydrolase family protein [Tunicatimonas pelagia]
MRNLRWLLSLLGLLFCYSAFAQDEIYSVNDVRDDRPERYLFTNATVVVDYQTTLQNASLLIEDGFIEAVGNNITAPAGTRTINLQEKYIYPSFVDLYSHYGLSEVQKSSGFRWGVAEKLGPQTKGPFSQNDAIKSQYSAADDFTLNEEQAQVYRELGFGTVLTNKQDGIARGSSALVTLTNVTANEALIMPEAASHYSFAKGSSTQYYPISKMGFIALLRQTYLNADWYQSENNEDYVDQSLEAWIDLQNLPQIFDAPGWVQILRADKLGDEFGQQYIIRGNGDEYQRLAEVKATNAPLIVPVNFPDAYDVDDPYDAENVDLADMMHWELAPANLGMLAQEGILFAITSEGTKDGKTFLKNLRKAVQYGLPEDAALRALTATPSELVRADGQLGSLQAGAIANFIITSDNIFNEGALIYENWVQGKAFIINEMDANDLRGEYILAVGDESYPLQVSGQPGKLKFQIVPDDTTKIDVTSDVTQETITLAFAPNATQSERIRLSGWIEGQKLQGRGKLPDGEWVSWEATYQAALEETGEEAAGNKTISLDDLSEIVYPFLPYGNQQRVPEAETYLIQNATVWTNEDQGILESSDVLVRDGKIVEVGQNLSANGATVIDGSGKHLTSGIIDEHSHIALSSVNDVATNSAMVRMKDVVESDDINIYRQLAGGVTASQLLHGSANPIGGQSALVKMRWGSSPQEMLIEGADEHIKFALGENVKRSSNNSSIRYPQTRMGVEQVYLDAFTRAREYDQAWQEYEILSSKEKANTPAPRRDLALEALAEILNSERFITCHSYVQSEINMLMHVADQFDFDVNTFTHILEGYKVADKMAEHGAGGSTFADWWAYKFEVRYAIPYNPTLMDMAGVTVAINSDDAEMARRLNQEAAKSVKYGGMSEEDAWKMVTLNPAKLLHLDDRMGSIKVGKDADLVLWTDNPLSIYARAEKTMVDGKIYYDVEINEEKITWVAEQRTRLVQKMQDAKKNGASTQAASRTLNQLFHCEDIGFGHTEHIH